MERWQTTGIIGKEESYKKELQEKTLKIEQDIAAIEEKKNNLSKKYQDAILEFENDYKNKTEDKKVAIYNVMQEQIQEMKAENEKQRIEIDKQKKEIFDNYGEVVKEYEEKKARAKEKYEKVINLEQNLYNRPCYCPKCDGVMIFVGCGCYKCEDCHHEMKDDWGKVRDYLYEPENRGKNALDIEQDLGIPRREVQAMLREGKIQYSSEGLSALMCQMCGTIITHGKYCEPCEKQLHKAKEEELKAQKMKTRQRYMARLLFLLVPIKQI